MTTVLLATTALALIIKDVKSNAAQREQARKAALPQTGDTSWTKQARTEGKIQQDDTTDSSERSASAEGATSENESRSSKYAGNAKDNTISMDDFRSSDEMAYRLIAFYGLSNGDGNWKKVKLDASKGITMTRQQSDAPSFVVQANSGSTAKAYYRYVMTSNDEQSQSRPLSFSQNDNVSYRATIADVLDFANNNGGRSAVEKMSFKLVS